MILGFDEQEVYQEYGISVSNQLSLKDMKYSVCILAVAHDEFLKLNLNQLRHKDSIVYDIKGLL